MKLEPSTAGRCGSGLQAVLTAASLIKAGGLGLAVAGGVESMSNVPHYSFDVRWGTASSTTLHDGLGRGRVTAGGKNYPVPGGMLETAENLRREFGISRNAQDELAVESHRRALQAQADGVFAEEIVPVTVPNRRGDTVIETDEHPRPGTTVESLGRLKPVLGRDDPEATVTAGNASGQNDAAAMCVVTTCARAEELGLHPLVRLVSWGLAGLGPSACLCDVRANNRATAVPARRGRVARDWQLPEELPTHRDLIARGPS